MFLYQVWTIFFPTLTKTAFDLTICSAGPNGKAMVIAYPGLECHSAEWWQLFPGTVFAIAVNIISYISFTAFLVHNMQVRLAKSNLKERGPWAAAFEDFRASRLLWPLVMCIKDVALILLQLFVSQAAATVQLLIVGIILYIYHIACMRLAPYEDYTNNFMESWSSGFAAFLVVYTAGLGISEDADLLFEHGAGDPAFKMRVICLLTLMLLSLTVPIGVVLSQILVLCRCFSAATRSVRVSHMDQIVTNWDDCKELLMQVDDVDFDRFSKTLLRSAHGELRWRKHMAEPAEPPEPPEPLEAPQAEQQAAEASGGEHVAKLAEPPEPLEAALAEQQAAEASGGKYGAELAEPLEAPQPEQQAAEASGDHAWDLPTDSESESISRFHKESDAPMMSVSSFTSS